MPDLPKVTHDVASPALPAGPHNGFRRLWLSLAFLLVLISGGATAQAPAPAQLTALALAQDEPITPIPMPPPIAPSKLALGERLFNDSRLSHDGAFSCATCHDVRTNGADARQRDAGSNGHEIHYNTNTVFNAALSFRLNWEGNIRTLEAQIGVALESPHFMGTNTDAILGKLKSDPEMVRLFRDAYGRPPDRDGLFDAIASYERSLLTPGSRFDQWLEGDSHALSADEKTGYQLFKTLGCVSCHQGVNVGGNLFERYGIFRPLSAAKSGILRVPSLRNIATTPPYFHDGSAPTLNDAIRKMAGAQLNRTLSDNQVASLIAFLRTLTGNYRGTPVTAPAP